ncbi:unnamed protein product [Urochloa humidicola]
MPNSAVPQTSPSVVAHILHHRHRHPSLPPVIAVVGFATGLRQATPQPFAAAGVIHLLSAPVKKTRPQGHSLHPAKVHCNEATFQSSSSSSWLSGNQELILILRSTMGHLKVASELTSFTDMCLGSS